MRSMIAVHLCLAVFLSTVSACSEGRPVFSLIDDAGMLIDEETDADIAAAQVGISLDRAPERTSAEYDALREETERECDARCAAVSDADFCGLSELGCLSACNGEFERLGSLCLEEYRDLAVCNREGDFTCAELTPVSDARCAAENGAFEECSVGIGCRAWCSLSESAACDPTLDYDSCVLDCWEDARAEGECQDAYDALRLCDTDSGIICEGGRAVPAGFTSFCSLEERALSDCRSQR